MEKFKKERELIKELEKVFDTTDHELTQLRIMKNIIKSRITALNIDSVGKCFDCEKPLINMYKLLKDENGDYACRECDEKYWGLKTGIYTTEFEGCAEVLIGDNLIVMDGANRHGIHAVTLRDGNAMISNETLDDFIQGCLDEGLNVLKNYNYKS
ncbi:MAG: hypothetical protein HRT69_13900 [Flavobacteriaceae bacterium]|nr:hypothetical protein [Flavobacteriaceae bacterium]